MHRLIRPCMIAVLLATAHVGQGNTNTTADTTSRAHIESLSIRGLTMRELAELLTRATDISVVASRGAAAIQIETYLQADTAENILKAVCRAYGLWFRVQESGVYEVLTMDEFRRSARIHQEDYVEVINVLYPSVEDVARTLRNLYPDRIVWMRSDERSDGRFENITDALSRMDQLAGRAQFALTSPGQTGTGQMGTGVISPMQEVGNRRFREDAMGSRRGRETGTTAAELPRRLENRETLVERLRDDDVRQIAEGEERSVWDVSGEFGYVYMASFPGPNRLVLRSSDLRALEQIRTVVTELDTITPQVLLEVKVLEINLGDAREQGVDWLFRQDFVEPVSQASGGFAGGTLSGTRGQQIAGPNLALAPQGSGLDTRAFVFNYISANFRARLQLLETQNRVTALANPTLTVADEEASIIFIGQETTIPLSLSSVDNYNLDGVYVGTSVNLETERRNVGDTLLVVPKLHADRTVTIRMLHENSQLGETRTIVYGPRGENVLNTQDIDRRTATSTVIAGDGQLVALGGLIRERVGTQREGIPYLQSLPLVGSLFRRSTERRERSELLILIIPHILVAPGESDLVTKRYQERMSQHPSAREDVPPLGATRPRDIARPVHADPERSALDRLRHNLQIWRVEP